MKMHVIGFTLTLLASFSLIHSKDYDDRVSLAYVRGKFVEGEVVEFSCTYSGGSAPLMRLTLFDWARYPSMLVRNATGRIKRTKNWKIEIIMRRDFAYGLLNCSTRSGLHSTFEFPIIKAKYRYRVSFDSQVLLGDNQTLTCDIWNYEERRRPSGNGTKLYSVVWIIHHKNRLSDAPEIWHPYSIASLEGGKRWRFTFNHDFNFEDNGCMVQCAGMLEPFEQQPAVGTLISKRVPLIIHGMFFMNVSQFPDVAIGGGETIITFQVKLSPPPKPTNFKVRIFSVASFRYYGVEQQSIDEKKHIFDVTLTFSPPLEGIGKVVYQDHLHKKESPAIRFYRIEITLLLDNADEPIQCVEGSVARISAQISSGEDLTKRSKIFSVPLLSGKKVVADVMDLDSVDFREIGDKKYLVALSARAYRTGNYCIALTVGVSTIRSPQFIITTVAPYKSRVKEWLYLGWNIFVLVVISLCFIQIKFRNRKRDDLAFRQYTKDFVEYGSSWHE